MNIFVLLLLYFCPAPASDRFRSRLPNITLPATPATPAHGWPHLLLSGCQRILLVHTRSPSPP
jgi:hypothetical protein